MRRLRALIAAVCVAVLAAAAACTPGEEDSIVGLDVLRIGVRADLPQVGQHIDGQYEGFDIAVAEYIAGELGAEIEFVAVEAADREPYLLDDRIDLAVATYSITQERKQKIDFAGPYVIEQFDVMAPAGGEPITDLRDLAGRTICELEGSNAIERVRDEHGIVAEVMQVDTYDECLNAIAEGRVDAITTDQFILAGLAYSHPELDLEILNIPFSRERVGIGMQPGDTAGCEAINRAISKMYDEGVMKDLLDEWFGPTDLDLPDTPPIPQFEGCE